MLSLENTIYQSLQRRSLLGSAGWLVLAASAWPVMTLASSKVRGAGASFPSKLYGRWAKQYALSGGAEVTYQATGSGDGVKQAIARTVDFAGTDAPLSAQELIDRKLVQIPTCVGGVVPVVNGFETQRLRLTGDLLADIMSGLVERWDDSRIAALNKGLNLPTRRIVRVVRADKSGTTEGFSKYLAGVSPRFAKDVGAGSLPNWQGEVTAAEGNDGVSQAVRSTPGAIGYVSHDRVESDNLSSVLLRNRDGHYVFSSDVGFRSAMLTSELYRSGLDTASLLDMPGTDAWPITLTTFVLIDANPDHAAAVEPALKFWYWCFMRGDALTRGTGFAPLPVAVQAKLSARFAQVRPKSGGRPVYQSF